LLADGEGASDFFQGGFVVYTKAWQRVARHHELQGKLRRLPPLAGVVQPRGFDRWRAGRFCRARQRPRDRRERAARRGFSLKSNRPETKVVPWGMLNFGHKLSGPSIFPVCADPISNAEGVQEVWATNVDLKKTQRTNGLPNAAEAGMNSGFSPNIARRNPRATLSCGRHKPAR